MGVLPIGGLMLLVPEMLGHLRLERCLQHGLRQSAQQASRPDEADALLLRLRKQLLGDLLLIDDLSRHGIDHLGHLGHCPSFRSGQSQIHRFPDSPGRPSGPAKNHPPRQRRSRSRIATRNSWSSSATTLCVGERPRMPSTPTWMLAMSTNDDADLTAPLWFSREAAAYLRVSEATLSRWRRQRLGPPFVQVGSIARYRASTVRDWVSSQESSRG